MPERIKVKTGDRYGRLAIVDEIVRREKGRFFLCQCDCGSESVVRLGHLRNGHTKSCGCLQSEAIVTTATTHGLYSHPLHSVWAGMKQRCNDKNDQSYERYGGRGIAVCQKWNKSFKAFHSWGIANGYQKGLTIERVDNNGSYEPSNCMWIPQSEQSKNTRRCIHIEVNGVSFQTLTDAANYFNVNINTAYARLKRNLTIEQALGVKNGN